MHRIILITHREFTDLVSQPLQIAAPGLRIEFAWSLEQLSERIRREPARTRLISLGSDIIVPKDLLNLLPGPAYNFHPGPPEYPGIFPSVFALYNNAKTFGVTLHEMAPSVDSGQIVALETFEIEPAWDRLALDTATFNVLQNLLSKLAPQLVDIDQPMPVIEADWGTPKNTLKDFDRLCRLPDNIDQAEFDRRYRAVGEGPDHALYIERFNRTFRLKSSNQETIVRGGKSVS